MTKVQKKALLCLISALIVIATIVSFSVTDIRKIENEIYEVIFSDVDVNSRNSILVLSKPSTCNSSEKLSGELSVELYQAFINANKPNAAPIKLNSLVGKVSVVDWDSTKNLNENPYLKFPPEKAKAYMLSRVGFIESNSKALMCIEYRDSLYSRAVLLYLTKEKGKWIIVNEYPIWIT